MTKTALPEMGSREMAVANARRLLSVDPAAAAEQAREILAKNERDDEALRLLARALHLLGRTAEARRTEAEAVEAATHNPVIAQIGRAILEGRPDEASGKLRPYLQRHPDDAAAVSLLAELIGRSGDVAQAEKLLRRSIELAPAFAGTRLRLATILCFQNKVQESLTVLDELLEIDPNSIAALD